MTGEGGDTLSPEEAQAWCAAMQNEDGTTGPHWSLEEATGILQAHGLTLEPYTFWAAMNASYSDLCAFFKKYNIDAADAYLDYTMTFWFKDQDAVKDKVGAYYEAVVKH